MKNDLPQAHNFAFDVQDLMAHGDNIRDAIERGLRNFPGAVVGEGITFPDGSRAILRADGSWQVIEGK